MKVLSTTLVLFAIVAAFFSHANAQALDKTVLAALYPTANAATTLEINLVNKNYTSVSADAFDAYTAAITINLDRNQLANVKFPFSKQTALANLYLSRNGMTSFEAANFETADTVKLKTVTSLDLSGNLITDISANYLFPAVAPALASLYLQNNQITQLKVDQFTSDKLYLMDLSNNKISSIGAGAFRAPALQLLNLASNQIGSLTASMISGSTKLVVLFIYANNITAFPTDAVTALPLLRDLDIGRNLLTELTGEFLGTNTALKTLKLDYNRISKLNLDVVNSPLRCFTTIDFTGNPIYNGLSITTESATSPCKKITCKPTNLQSGICTYNSSGRLAMGSIWILVTMVGSYFIKY